MKSRKNIILLVVSSSIFFEALDIAIVNLAIPHIQKSFKLTSDTVQWLQTLYVLFYGGFLIIGGKLADVIGRKRIFLIGSAIFLITSLGAGLSTSFAILAFFRAFQGLGAAFVLPAAFSIVTNTFVDPQERGKAISVFGAFAAVGSGSGLSIGGLIATYMGWQWMFFINVPVITIVLVLASLYVDRDKNDESKNSADLVQGVLLTLCMLSLSYAIHELAHLKDNILAILLALVVALFSGFIFLKRNGERKTMLVDVSVFNNSSTVLGCATIFVMGAFFTGYLFIISLTLQFTIGFTAAKSGIVLFPFSILSALVSKYMVPVLIQRIQARRTGIVGMLSMTTGALAFIVFLLSENFILLLISTACVTGIGIAVCFTSLNMLVIRRIPEQQQGLASGIANTCYFFGSGLGLSILSFFMQLTIPHSIQELVPVITLFVFALSGLLWLLIKKE